MPELSLKCEHAHVSCLNPYEIIRKYRCEDCGGIMMCACTEDFAVRFLPHQIKVGSVLETGQRIPVTLGFVNGICNACRGVPEPAFPKAEMFGATSKIKRYYWREIHIETIRAFAEWANQSGYSDWFRALTQHKDKYAEAERVAIEKIKKLHATNPKYVYEEESDDSIIRKYNVEIVRLSAKSEHHGKKLLFQWEKDFVSPERFAANHFQKLGYSTLITESAPFHVIFGVFLWMLIEDFGDPQCRMVSFGDRFAFEQKLAAQLVWINLPGDFGKSGYYARRNAEINKHLATIPLNAKELLWVFDYWVDGSKNIRQYLWAHRKEHISTARQIVQILPPETVIKILDYLLTDYWANYCGWPDLLVYNKQEFFFVEVKSPKDDLLEDQKNWIKNNAEILKFNFKLFKILNSKKEGQEGKIGV